METGRVRMQWIYMLVTKNEQTNKKNDCKKLKIHVTNKCITCIDLHNTC